MRSKVPLRRFPPNRKQNPEARPSGDARAYHGASGENYRSDEVRSSMHRPCLASKGRTYKSLPLPQARSRCPQRVESGHSCASGYCFPMARLSVSGESQAFDHCGANNRSNQFDHTDERTKHLCAQVSWAAETGQSSLGPDRRQEVQHCAKLPL